MQRGSRPDLRPLTSLPTPRKNVVAENLVPDPSLILSYHCVALSVVPLSFRQHPSNFSCLITKGRAQHLLSSSCIRGQFTSRSVDSGLTGRMTQPSKVSNDR